MEVDKSKIERTLELMKQFQLKPHEEAITLLKDMLAPEPRFYVGQPVLVDGEDIGRIDGHHSEYGYYVCKPTGTCRHYEASQIKLYPDAVSLMSWQSVINGKIPECPVNHTTVLSGDGEHYAFAPWPKFID